ncbi:FkbM family methyltransferase [Stenotrophomonas mori]|uniref:FkbM family methyltransferase n=1 Tax=Stenotrophomonas mori TaxID=2871096 RepID=A0ABT0SCY5_9GAMM|nr:FkbM family methyltransferase [Stenotrophomonas mori]MCL7713177.1 FkbM family methyltransferase [Stenotrophomonas mori]
MFLPRSLDMAVQRFLKRKGYVRTRAEDGVAIARRARLLASQGIDLVLDVGANTGQFALQMRGLGYRGRIHSFEPMQAAWARLCTRMAGDPLWSGTQAALGERCSEESLNVASNSVSSSFLEMLPTHLANAPRSAYLRDETVRMSRLDDIFPELASGMEGVWLKLDVQGYEYNVLEGGRGVLPRCRIVQLEMSLAPPYAGQRTFLELCSYMDAAGFDPVGFEAGFQEPASGILLQVDGIFRNRRFAGGGDDGVGREA